MTYEIKLDVKDPRGLVALLRGMLPINADDFNPDERPTIEGICAQIEEQVKPAIEEPTEFGSTVRAGRSGSDRVLWTPSPWHGSHYWGSETGITDVWSELTDVEVLRVGIGELESTEEEVDQQQAEANRILHKLNSVAAGTIVPPDAQLAAYYDEMNRPDETSDYRDGFSEAKLAMRQQLRILRAEALTAERQNAYDKAIAAVKEIQP